MPLQKLPNAYDGLLFVIKSQVRINRIEIITRVRRDDLPLINPIVIRA